MSQIQIQCCVPNLGIDETASKTAGEILLNLLSNQLALGVKLNNYAFNTNGPRYTQLALFFCEQAKELKCLADCTAEQIRTLGIRVPTVVEILGMTSVGANPTDWYDENSILKDCLREQEKVIQSVTSDRQKVSNVKEFVIENFLIDAIKSHRKLAWKTRAHIEHAHPSAMSGQ
jgi:starvation-inducible DNA-binding protein